MIEDNIKNLEISLGYTFKNIELLRTALTHSSSGEANNQRLEFLGDAVLEICISNILYKMTPPLSEGEMTQYRSQIVSEAGLFAVAKYIKLGQYIRMGRSFKKMGGAKLKSVQSDTLEAVLAAIFLDGGIDSAMDVVSRLFEETKSLSQNIQDYKTMLQERTQKHSNTLPEYTLINTEGPSHKPRFTCTVSYEGKVLGTGTAGSIKQAEQEAAQQALSVIEGVISEA